MANHRWDTEPPTALPSRLAVRRRAAGNGLQPEGSAGPGGDTGSGSVQGSTEPEWQLTDFGEDPNAEADRPAATKTPRRWRFPLRAGVLAACLMLAAAAAVPLMRDRASAEVLSVELGSVELGSVELGSVEPGSVEPGSNLATPGPEGTPDSPGEAGTRQNPAGGAGSSAEAASGGAEPGTPDNSAGSGTELVVHVAGAVAVPGLVRVPEGSRVADAVAAAGGATGEADLTRVNLAAPMTDGSMVVIPAQGEPAASVPGEPGTGYPVQTGPGPSAGQGSGGGASAVNLNTAGEAELQTLPRVGPVLASRIIAWRTEHGPFQRPEDLDAVPGIGEAMLAALLPLVSV
ncbi:MAG: helix-hairpin-helix domain-containing protein [Arthrobacter sp.]